MSIIASTDGYSRNVGSVTMQGSWSGAQSSPTVEASFQWGYGSFGNTTSIFVSNEQAGSYTRTPTVDKDRTIKFRAKARDLGPNVTHFGFSSGEFRTFADPATFSGLTPGTPTTNTCPVSGSVIPRTVESTGNVSLEYRIAGTGNWISGGQIASNISGSSSVGLSATLTALAPGTAYEARFKIERSTENSQINYSNVGTFTTQAVPTVVLAPSAMLATMQTFPPTLAFGTPPGDPPPGEVAGSIIINVAVMDVMAEMFTPQPLISQPVVVEVFVQFNDIIERSVHLG